MLLYNCSAKNPALSLTQLTARKKVGINFKCVVYIKIKQLPMARRPFSMSPENSFLMAFSMPCPVRFWYSTKTCCNCIMFLETKIALNVDSSVPNFNSPKNCKNWFKFTEFTVHRKWKTEVMTLKNVLQANL